MAGWVIKTKVVIKIKREIDGEVEYLPISFDWGIILPDNAEEITLLDTLSTLHRWK